MTITLQELITRARFVMSGAPSRLQVFEAVDGRRTIKEIADALNRHENNVRRDLSTLADVELIQIRGEVTRSPIYEKVPLARAISSKYFAPIGKRPANASLPQSRTLSATRKSRRPNAIVAPSELEILEIAKDGEGQLYEFKAAGAEPTKLTREIAAMLNTKQGGVILYGVEDDGAIAGSDKSRQAMDQPLQNSIKGITPAATIHLSSVKVFGTEVLVIVVPPWNGHDVYQYQEKFYVRKGTNVFVLKPEELKSMYGGTAVI